MSQGKTAKIDKKAVKYIYKIFPKRRRLLCLRLTVEAKLPLASKELVHNNIGGRRS